MKPPNLQCEHCDKIALRQAWTQSQLWYKAVKVSNSLCVSNIEHKKKWNGTNDYTLTKWWYSWHAGVDEHGRQLLYFDSCNEIPKRALRFSLSALERKGSMSVQTNLIDQHCYVFDTKVVLDILESKKNILSIKEVPPLLPFLSLFCLEPGVCRSASREWTITAMEISHRPCSAAGL